MATSSGMIQTIKNIFRRLTGAKVNPVRVILIGIDYPSHALGKKLQEHGVEIIAFIDDEPWNHRTKMLGATVHYPSELLALVKRYAVSEVVLFDRGSIELEGSVLEQIHRLSARIVRIDEQQLTIEEQIAGVLVR